jgi:RNA polymerase sigma-70 factor (ECF subfamily)
MDRDRELVNRVIEGDYDAFEILVERHQGRVYRHLRKMVKDYGIAEDLLQETFLSAYKGLNSFSGNSSFATWLFRIATNTALMFLRKHRPEIAQYDDDLKTPAHSGHTPGSAEFANTPLDLLLSDEGRRKIEQAIDELPLMYRTVLMLRDIEGFSVREVSKITDSSEAAIKSRLHRARHSVREALSSYYSEHETYASRGVTAK